MNSRTISIALLAFLTACASPAPEQTAQQTAAQDAATLIRENIDRAAGVHHSYEYAPSSETPAPKGYKPFYISHYGRHGSRRNTSSSATRSHELMNKAMDAGILSDKGRELFEDVEKVWELHEGMIGELSPRGAREHRDIAERMYARTPEVFRKRTEVDAQSSNVQRCLISMANFTSSLDDCAPQLRFSFVTGEKYIDLLAHDYFDQDSKSDFGWDVYDSLILASFDPSRFIEALFRVPEAEVEQVVGDLQTFAQSIYFCGSISQCLDYPADIFGKYFTFDELMAQYIAYNDRCYNSMGNGLEYGDNVLWGPAQGLTADIVDRADAAIAEDSNRAADLRFGHDTGILPLACIIGLEGVADRYPVAEAHEHWQSFQNVPMASNLQMIFYRNRKDDILVKLLYNEKETAVPALTPVSGPYYRWTDLKEHLLRRTAEINAKFAGTPVS